MAISKSSPYGINLGPSDVPPELSLKEQREINSNNPIIQDYLDYLLTIKGYSDHTLTSYKHDLVWLFRFLLLRNKRIDLNSIYRQRKNGTNYIDYTMINISEIGLDEIKAITYPDLIAFLAFTAKELKNSENSRKRKVTTLKGFFRYLTSTKKVMNENPAQDLEAPKIGRPQPHYLTLEQAQSLIDAPIGLHSIRDKAILTIFLNTGIRVSELVNLKVSDLQKEMIHITGKGKKDRVLYLNDAALQAIANYLPIREKQIHDQMIEGVEFLFISQKGSRFSIRGIEHMIEKYIKKIGLDPRKYTVHTLRHTAATLMHLYGEIDIKTLQQVLGHESTQTTEIYTHLENNELRNALNSNPLSQYKTNDEADLSSVFDLS